MSVHFAIPPSAREALIEWPPQSERFAHYTGEERRLVKELIASFQGHEEDCPLHGAGSPDAFIPFDTDNCKGCRILNEITLLHELKIEFGVDLIADQVAEHALPEREIAYEQQRLTDDLPDTTARARTTDPTTSHEAAATLDPSVLRESQEAVLTVFRRHGPMSDDELVTIYGRGDFSDLPQQSPSGLRTRRSELVDSGFICDSGKRVLLDSGRNAIVWKLS